jgi:hypothetical protein
VAPTSISGASPAIAQALEPRDASWLLANGTNLTSAQVTGGTSGIIVDNNYVTKDGSSSIYFSGLSANTAYKFTQQGLQ